MIGGAFTPVTLNLGLGLLAAIDLLTLDGIPSAGRCRRSPRSSVIDGGTAMTSIYRRALGSDFDRLHPVHPAPVRVRQQRRDRLDRDAA